MLDENNPFNNKMKAEDIYIETNLFDDTDWYKTKKVSDSVFEKINFGDNIESLKKGKSEKKTNKSAEWLKKASFLETDDLQTIDYNNDVTRYLKTVDFNNETQMTSLTDIDKIDSKKISETQQAAKKIII